MALELKPIQDSSYYQVPLNLIDPNPHQPRRFFDGEALRALAESMKKIGQLEDVLLRPKGDGRFELVLGERRWRASHLAGMETINAKVRELSDADTFLISLSENVQREDLTGVEEAFAFKRYLDEGLTQEETAAALGKLDQRVGEKLKLLSSSFYVRYMEARVAEIEKEIENLQRENRVLLGSNKGSGATVKVASGEDELCGLLEDGWTLITSLPNERFVLRRVMEGNTIPVD